MNKKQLSEYIGNIDDRLVKQAEKILNYRQLHRHQTIRRLITAAAAFVLMAGSFSAGAFAFAREIVVEVPVEQETIRLEEINLTMILPDDWEGKYSVEKNGQNYIVYHPQIRAGFDTEMAFNGGILFYIVCHEESMTPEQFVEKGYDFVGYRYLFSTSDKTYILFYPSDVQWNPENPDQETEYLQMEAEIKNIKFVVDNILVDGCSSVGKDSDTKQRNGLWVTACR